MLLHCCELATLKKVRRWRAGEAADSGEGQLRRLQRRQRGAPGRGPPDMAVVETSINFVDQANFDHGLAVAGGTSRRHRQTADRQRRVAGADGRGLERVRPAVRRSPAADEPHPRRRRPAGLERRLVEFALRFTLSQPGVHTAIIGTTNPDNARKNFAIAEKGPLPPQAVEKIPPPSARRPDGRVEGAGSSLSPSGSPAVPAKCRVLPRSRIPRPRVSRFLGTRRAQTV